MNDKRASRAALVLLALINMLPAIEAEESWILFAVVAAAGLVGLMTWRDERRRGVPAVIVFAGVAGAIAFLIYEMFFPPEGSTVYVLDLAHFMILLCGCKFLELRSNRDLGLTAIIASLVLVIGAFVSGSIIFAIAVVVDITFGLWWLLAFQMRREFDAVNQRAALSNSLVKMPAAVERSPALYRPALLIGMGMSSVAIMLFVAVPRGWGRTMLGSIQRVMPSMTGFGEEVELTGTPLIESDVQVMRVRFSRNGQPIVDEDFRPYMRGVTMEGYYRGNWRRTVSRERKPVRVESKALPVTVWPERSLIPEDQIIEQEVWLDRTDRGVLFAMYPALSIGSEKVKQARANPSDQSLVMIQPRGTPGVLNYVVESPVRLNARIIRGLNRFDQTGRPEHGTYSVPSQIAEEARRLAEPAGDYTNPAEHEKIVNALMRHLNGSQFVYSLDPGTRGMKGDPVVNFLLTSRRGHCEYFASALTLMCQALDIPARFASGYYGGELNPVGGYYQFRARDAHAWVEVFLPGKGWTLFDPTPASGTQWRNTELGLLSELKRLAGYLQFEWSTFVVAFDADHRQELVMGFINWLEGLTSDPKGQAISWRTIGDFFWGPNFLSKGQRAVYWLFLLLCTVMLVAGLRVTWIVGILVREFLPRGRRGFSAPVRVSEAKFYDRVLHLLARKGHVKADRETPREFAARLKLRHLDLEELPAITEMFYAAQYGARTLEADARERVSTFMQRLREEPGFGAR